MSNDPGSDQGRDLLTSVPGPFRCFGLDHQPISMLDASILLSSPDRIIASTVIGTVTISTVFLVFDHSHSQHSDPVLYETMVFRDDRDATWCERYRSRDAALAGHDRASAWVRSPEQAPAPLHAIVTTRAEEI